MYWALDRTARWQQSPPSESWRGRGASWRGRGTAGGPRGGVLGESLILSPFPRSWRVEDFTCRWSRAWCLALAPALAFSPGHSCSSLAAQCLSSVARHFYSLFADRLCRRLHRDDIASSTGSLWLGLTTLRGEASSSF